MKLAAAVIGSLFLGSAGQAVTYDEGINGDLSGNPNAPTNLGTFGVGTHTVIATDSGAAQDNITFSIPAGASLDQIFNVSYNGADGTAFIGIASGTTIDQGGAPGTLLGYTHFGTGPGTVGTNILDDIAVGPGAAGFTPPLGPGNYAVWMQQAGLTATFRMDFVVIPEPASLGLLAVAGTVLFTRRGRV
jgi:hypothetical protein